MKLRTGNQNISIAYGQLTNPRLVFANIPTLIDGGIEPSYTSSGTPDDATYAWTPFVESSFTQNTSDAFISDSTIPGRFLTPYQADAANTEFVDVLVHPYSGHASNNASNNISVYFYLNGGPAVQGVKRIRNGVEVYSARVPSSLSYAVNEVRAAVVPQYGKAAILQCAGMTRSNKALTTNLSSYTGDFSLGLNDRGCLLVNYSDVVLDTDVNTTVSGNGGNTKLRIDCLGSTLNYSTAAYRHTGTRTGSEWGNPYLIVPRLTNGTILTDSSTDFGFVGFVLDSVTVTTDLENNTCTKLGGDDGSEVWFLRGGFNYRTPYYQFENCTFQPKEDRSYRTGQLSAVGETLVSRGFGELVRAYDLGYSPRVFALNPYSNEALGTPTIALSGCHLKYTSCFCSEAIDTIAECPAPNNSFWVFGRAGLLVNCSDYGQHKYMYPWGSIGYNQVTDFSYDWTSHSTSVLPLSPSSATVSGGTTAMHTTPSGGLSQGENKGCWGDWYQTIGLDNIEISSLLDPNSTGTLTDHLGNSYSAVGTGVGEYPYESSLDIHMDTANTFGYQVGYTMYCNNSSYGQELNRQVMYHSNTLCDCIASWGWTAVENATVQYPISIGAETRAGSSGYQGNSQVSNSQFMGPDIKTLSASTLQEDLSISLRDFCVGADGSDTPGNRGFLYSNSLDTRFTSVLDITDDGSSVIQASPTKTIAGTKWRLVVLDRA